MQRSHVLLVLVFISALLLAGCGPRVEVPPGNVGKLSSPDGLQKGIIQPSKFRLDTQWPLTIGDSLILVQAHDLPAKEKMEVFMPKDQLNLTVDVRGTFTISTNEQNVNKIFAKLQAHSIGDRISQITMQQTYKTYAEPVIREVVRSNLTKYSIQEVMKNRERINAELKKKVYDRLGSTPIKPIYFGLADVQPPPIILKAQEKAKE
ncbi:MAG: SPFH domain-containing protein, partial [Candidatus Aenigmatarchaeota archaeon]